VCIASSAPVGFSRVEDALVARGYLSEGERANGTALKNAIEAVLSDVELELKFETAERGRIRV
jgi:hypothetical protein